MKRRKSSSHETPGKGHKHRSASREARGGLNDFFKFPGCNNWILGLFLLGITFLAYQPVWQAGFIWDDDRYVTSNNTLHSLGGLWQIWLVPGATVQYYPLTFTTFWLEYHLWGLHPFGFHLVNVLLHSFNAILFWTILKRLDAPGAWLAAGIFALHPVCVESVAWVTELKNTLSTLFYLGSLWAAINFWLPREHFQLAASTEESAMLFGSRRFYWLALELFICALGSKTAAIPLPVVVLLLVWWKRGKIKAREGLLTVPFLAVGMAMGLVTMHFEKHLGASGNGWDLSMLDRCLIAGKDLSFYLGKLFWPYPLIYVYPRWETNTSQPIAFLPLAGAIVGLFILWVRRNHWGRGAFSAMAYFVLVLLPVLGFFNVYYFRYSFVSDHFQYLASLGPIALVAAGITSLGNRNQLFKRIMSLLLLLMLGGTTWRQCAEYADSETIWQATIIKNPDAWLAQNNLGHILLEKGQPGRALALLQKADEIYPDDAEIQNSLGSAWLQSGNMPAAFSRFQKALEINPDFALAYNNLGDFYLKQGKPDEALPYLRKALAIQPDLVEANYNLGNAFLQSGDLNAAIQQWQKTLDIDPGYVAALNNLGNAFLNCGQIERAIEYFQKAVAGSPDYAEAENNLGSAFIEAGEWEKASKCLRKALKSRPDFVAAQNNLAWLLATCSKSQLRDGSEAVELAEQANQLSGGHNPLILRTLAAAYAENGQFKAAISIAKRALQFVPISDPIATTLEEQLQLYESGLPVRDSVPNKVPNKRGEQTLP